jgi:hypothetical protein
MSQSESPGSAHPNSPDPTLPTDIDIEQWIEKLQHSHHLRSQMMSLNAWTLAETMDLFLPGFWHRFMTNRQTALQQFLGLMLLRVPLGRNHLLTRSLKRNRFNLNSILTSPNTASKISPSPLIPLKPELIRFQVQV